MTPSELMGKAARALASAKLLADAGDVDGACNRAYYAMFDAARAALLQTRAPAQMAAAKTHSGLISAFSLQALRRFEWNSRKKLCQYIQKYWHEEKAWTATRYCFLD